MRVAFDKRGRVSPVRSRGPRPVASFFRPGEVVVTHLKTREVLAVLGGVSYYRLVSALRGGKISPPPAKDASGDYVWTEEDVDRARQALARDGRKERKAARQGKAVSQ
jgi:hypothetical protein